MKSLPEIRNSTLKQIKEKISYMLTKIKSSLLLINLNFQVSTCIFNCSIKASQLYRLYYATFAVTKRRPEKISGLYECSTGITEFKGSNPIQA